MNRLFICHKSIKSKLITMNFQDFLVFQQPRIFPKRAFSTNVEIIKGELNEIKRLTHLLFFRF